MSEKTKDKILKAAKALFIKQGFHATSVIQIAKLAVVQKSLIFHYFANKENLWKAVKENIIGAIDLEPIPYQNLSFQAYLSNIITQRVRLYERVPELDTLIKWQSLSAESQKLEGTAQSRPKQWIEAFRYFQKKNECDPSLDPDCVFYFIYGAISSCIAKENIFFNDKRKKAAYVEMITQKLFLSLKAP